MWKPNLAEDCHIVNILPPHDANTVATPVVFTMAKAAHASIVLALGVTGAAITVTLEACTASDGSGNTAIAFAYYAQTTAAGDVIGARTEATTSGFATSTNDNIYYVIEVDASALPEGKPWLRLVLSDPGAATFASAIAILVAPRFGARTTALS